jgi:protein-S-isoprenylcysteine O-methyltransferase Ste14
MLFLAALLFLPAGRADLPAHWVFMAICSVLTAAAIVTIDPDLARERRRPGPGGIDPWLRRTGGPLFTSSIILASLDVGRFHWSDPVPRGLQAAMMVAFAVLMALPIWSMAVNRFFSSEVRLQKERGHHLITSGPYRLVRHPGYTGMLFGGLACPIALGSWWGVVPAAIFSALVLRRCRIEDRFLREKLEGYAAFSERVRYRLVPGLW